METEEEQRSKQRWQRLQRPAATEDLVVPAPELDDGSWDRRRAQHHADAGAEAGSDGDDLEMRRDYGGWRLLKAVSRVVFTARPNKATPTTTTEMEPLYPPQQPRSDDQSRMAAREAEIRLRSPQRKTREVDVSKLNTGPWLNSPQRRSPAKVQPSLSPQQPAESGSKNSVPEVVVDVVSPKTAQVGVAHSKPDDDKEQRGRCLKYSQKALGFAVCTFIGYAANASTNTAFKMAIAPFFLAICADLLALKTKGSLGNALVYFSSLHLLLMTYLIFIAFDMDHAYAILFLPVVVFASHLQQRLWPPKQDAQQSAEERNKAASKELDNIYELSSLILNWSSFVSALMTVLRHFITDAGKENDEIAPGAVGLLFFLTIVLGIYLMLASTVRNPAMNLPTKYLDVVLICLLLSTLIATVMTFNGANWKERQSPPASGSSEESPAGGSS